MRLLSLTTPRLICLFVLGLLIQIKVDAQTAVDMPVAKTYQGTVWRTTPDLNNAIISERGRNALLLNIPNQQEVDKATYAAYDRLLDLILQDLPSGSAVEEIAVHDFQKVITDAPNDPALKAFDQGLLRHYFNQLIEIMSQPLVPVPVAAPSGL